MKTFIERATEIQQDIIGFRRKLHQDPEISFKEYRTTEMIRQILIQSGVEIVEWGGETGVVGLLKGARPGPVVALRADIDALPVQEENDCVYRSRNPGVMHACGHDIHTAGLLGAVILLAERRDRLSGTVKFIFQPAEEINAGAKLMLEKGVLDNPAVSVIFGLHNMPNIPCGQVCLKTGGLMAAVDTTFLTINGVGGHGAIPHRTHDPITAAAAIIQGLQTVVSRQVDPLDSAVISFGTIHGGVMRTTSFRKRLNSPEQSVPSTRRCRRRCLDGCVRLSMASLRRCKPKPSLFTAKTCLSSLTRRDWPNGAVGRWKRFSVRRGSLIFLPAWAGRILPVSRSKFRECSYSSESAMKQKAS